MARPRKPTNVLELTGRFRTNPERRRARENEPQPDTKLSNAAPLWMTKKQKKCYREIIRGCHEDVLSQGDRTWVEITACLLSEYRDDPVKMGVSKVSRLMACLEQLGMTPASRQRVSKISKKKENRFSKFAAMQREAAGE